MLETFDKSFANENEEEPASDQEAFIHYSSFARFKTNCTLFFKTEKNKCYKKIKALKVAPHLTLKRHRSGNPSRLHQPVESIFFRPMSTDPLLNAVELNELSAFKVHLSAMQEKLNMDRLATLNLLTTNEGVTLLHYAALYGSPDIVRFLLAEGMNKEALTRSHETVLDFALKTKQQDVIALLNDTHAVNLTKQSAF